MIRTLREILGITLLATALLLPLVSTLLAAREKTSEQAEQITLMQLEEVSDLIMSPGV
jgi:hypothetical protein